MRPVEDLQAPLPVEQLPVQLGQSVEAQVESHQLHQGVEDLMGEEMAGSAGWSSAGRWSGARRMGAVGGTACPAYAFSLLSVVFVVALICLCLRLCLL